MNIDRLQRSRRKTVALYVRPDGSLEVRAPLRLGMMVIQAFVDSKSGWIDRQRKKMSARVIPYPRVGYANGDSLWFLGKILTLNLTAINRGRLKIVDDQLMVPVSLQNNLDASLIAWYRAEARRVIKDRVEYFAKHFGLAFKSIRINSARARWGSCGVGNNLNFPYRLVMAPLEIIDYVVVHELVHTSVHNHGKGFWAKVAVILPDYARRRKWLQVNGHLFDLSLEADPDKIVAVQSKIQPKTGSVVK